MHVLLKRMLVNKYQLRAEGGAGAVQLAEAVVEACAATRADPSGSFKLLYPSEASIKARGKHTVDSSRFSFAPPYPCPLLSTVHALVGMYKTGSNFVAGSPEPCR